MATEIHEFPLGIYPRRLWVAVGLSVKVLTDYFGEDIQPMPDSVDGLTLQVQKQKPKKLGGILVWFPDRSSMTTSNIAHEATHFAIDVFKYTDCRIDSENQEPFAYLVGWASDMMDKVRRKDYSED